MGLMQSESPVGVSDQGTASLAVGVDLGGTKIQVVALAGTAASVIGSARSPTPTGVDTAAVVAAIADCVKTAVSNAGGDLADVRGLGIGSPGRVDRVTGEVSGAANVGGFAGTVPLGLLLYEAFDAAFTVRVENDVRAAVLGELRRGAARPFRNCLGIWLGTGVGGAVVIDRELYSGAGAAGEIGHTMVRPGGRRCSCGKRGCLEAYAGRACMEARALRQQQRGESTRLFAIMDERGKQRLTSGVWARAYAERDELAQRLLHRAAWALGDAMASAQNLLDFEAIVIGGGLGDRLGAGFRKRAQRQMTRHLLNGEAPPVVLGTELGDFGGAIGAALLVGPSRPATRRGRSGAADSKAGTAAAAGAAGAAEGNERAIGAVRRISRKRQS